MPTNPVSRAIFTAAILLALAYLLQFFYKDLLWGSFLALLMAPLAGKLQARVQHNSLATALVLFGPLLLLGLPIGLAINSLTTEVVELTAHLTQLNKQGVPIPSGLAALPFIGTYLADWWAANLVKPGGVGQVLKHIAVSPNVSEQLSKIPAFIAGNLLHMVLALLVAWTLVLHRFHVVTKVKSVLIDYLPDSSQLLTSVVPQTVRATALGLGSVAILEGVLLGVAYWIAGAPYPLFLALCTGYLALIPGGAPASFTIVSLILLAKGAPYHALGLFTWGAVELFLVDKFVRPTLIGRDVGLPFLAILFGLLGGVTTMGPVGLFVGPVLMALAFNVFNLRSHQ